MPINALDSNGKSKIISRKTGVRSLANHGISDKMDSSAPSHQKRPIVDLGHARSTIGDNETRTHEKKESKKFEGGEDTFSLSR